jgi:flavodoxin
MNTLVVHDSQYGNTEKVVRLMGGGAGRAPCAEPREARLAPSESPKEVSDVRGWQGYRVHLGHGRW